MCYNVLYYKGYRIVLLVWVIVIVVVIFIVCYVFEVYSFLCYFIKVCEVIDDFVRVVFFFVVINFVVNLIVYVLFKCDIKKEIRNIVCFRGKLIDVIRV